MVAHSNIRTSTPHWILGFKDRAINVRRAVHESRRADYELGRRLWEQHVKTNCGTLWDRKETRGHRRLFVFPQRRREDDESA